MERYLRRDTSKTARIIAISDIHGDAALLSRLLDRVSLRSDDLLVFVGDYINRRRQSAETLRLLMRMAGAPNVVILKGNMDRLIDWYLYRGTPEELLRHFDDYRAHSFGILFEQWAAECGFSAVTAENFAEIRAVLAERYADEARFVRELPFGLETDGHIFVHAGVSAARDWTASTEQELLKNDPFLLTGANNTGKTVVVGHTPVWNSPLSANTNNPICDRSRGIIGIDGGIGVKSFSQLNALVISHTADGFGYETLFVDEYPRFCAQCGYAPQQTNGVFKDSWPDYFLELVQRGEDFSLCRLTASRKEGLVKNEHIAHSAGAGDYFAQNSVSTLLRVEKGERLALLDGSCGRFAYVKNEEGSIGWVPAEVVGKTALAAE